MSDTAQDAHLSRLLKAMRCVGTGGRELRPTLEQLCASATDLTDARYAAIGVLAASGEGLSDFVQHGSGGCVSARGSTGRRSLNVPIQVGAEDFGNLCVTGKNGDGVFTDHDLDMVRVLAAEAGIAIGHVRLYEAAGQRERWIDGSVAVTTALLSGDDADEALQVVAEQARVLSGSAAGIVLLPAAEGGLEVASISPERLSGMLGLVIPPDSEVAGELLAGRAVFVEDATKSPHAFARLAPHFGPVMLLPLKSDGRVIGALATPRVPGARTFTEAERVLAVRFASQAALALMTAQARQDQQRLAVFEDRDRIARDLHDLVIKRLFATGMTLEGVQRGSALPGVREGVGKAVDELDITIQEIRGAIFALREEPAENPVGLRGRVRREIRMASAALGFAPSCRFVGPVDTAVGEVTGANVIASLREALSNAFRHAGATRIDVTVDAAAILPGGVPGVRLTVADDGVGIAEGGRRSGLRNLERRAVSLGGEYRHGPGLGENGGGTTVVWQAPHGRPPEPR